MKLAAIPLAFLCGSLTVAAQTFSSGPASSFGVAGMSGLGPGGASVTELPAQPGNGCPVWMRLDQRLGSRLETVQAGKRVEVPATRLHLSAAILPFAHHDQIKSATITLHGFDGGQRFELIGSAKAVPETAWSGLAASTGPVKTLDVNFVPAGARTAAAEVLAPGFGSVSFLEVDSIVYADGAAWKPAPGTSCRVKPDLFQLISAPQSVK